MSEFKRSLGHLYLEETKLDRKRLARGQRLEIGPAEPFKRYPKAEKVLLPRRWDGEESNLWQVLQSRRSQRLYSGGSITKEDLSLLLWASQGVTAQAGPYYLRTAPSAGALYPIETYLAALGVEEVEPGLLHFDVRGFQLELLFKGRLAEEITIASLGQRFLSKASVIFIWTAVVRRTMSKYGNRGVRYIFMDAGHLCQNLLLAAQALELAACPVAAFFDQDMNHILGVDGTEETVVYMAAVAPPCMARSDSD